MSLALHKHVGQFEIAPQALQDRVILLVGAHGALGSVTAKAMAAAGATVVLLGRRVPKLNRVYDAIVAAGGPTPALYPLDLEGAGPADYEQLAATIERECGRLDGIVHAAADFKGLVAFGSVPAEDWIRSVHVNLTAPVLLTQACLPLLQRGEDAAVVVLVDEPKRIERAYWGAYAMAHAGRAAWVRSLGDELENGPVRVHGLCPGPMRTELRARAFFAEDPGQWPDPAAYVPALVWALASGSAELRGQVVELSV